MLPSQPRPGTQRAACVGWESRSGFSPGRRPALRAKREWAKPTRLAAGVRDHEPLAAVERGEHAGFRAWLCGDAQDNFPVLTARCAALERCAEVLQREYGVNLRPQLGQ
jgi:hypothetical protein